MMQFSSFMWMVAIFFAVIGYLRRWNRELVATAGILLALFAVFQFDPLLRSYIVQIVGRDQVFLIEVAFFLIVVFIVYQARDMDDPDDRRDEEGLQDNILGALLGAFNGYLVGGTIWYFFDINEYPLPQYVTAPAVGSPSAESIDIIPLVLIGGGASGTGDLLAVLVIILLFVVIVSL